jgi:hypothetical protein
LEDPPERYLVPPPFSDTIVEGQMVKACATNLPGIPPIRQDSVELDRDDVLVLLSGLVDVELAHLKELVTSFASRLKQRESDDKSILSCDQKRRTESALI